MSYSSQRDWPSSSDQPDCDGSKESPIACECATSTVRRPGLVRILYIDEVPQIAGGANSILQLMRFLDTSRYERFFACPPGDLLDAAAAAGVKTLAYTFRKRYESIKVGRHEIPLNPYRLALRFRDALRLNRFIRRERIDLVHTNNLDSHLTGWFLNKLFRIPVIWHIRILTWPRSFYRPPWVNRIIFVSESVRRAALGSRAGDPRAIVIPNGLDLDGFKYFPEASSLVRIEFGWPTDCPIVGTVGRLTQQKRHELLVRAAQVFKSEGRQVRWLIVGGEIENRRAVESEEQRLRALARELNVEQEVVFAGDRRDVARLLSAFDVFAFPAFNDSNPRSVLEAMALGRPIVASRSGGLPELLDDGRAGVLVEPDNLDAMVGALRDLLTKPEQARDFGDSARARARACYTIQAHARRAESVYESVLSEFFQVPEPVD